MKKLLKRIREDQLENEPPQKKQKFEQEKESYTLVQGSALQSLKNISNETISLIITSPPYNIGKEYETKKPLEDYLQEKEKIIIEIKRVLKNTGSVCWQVGSYVNDGEIFPLDIYFYQLFKKHGFYLRNRIVWHFGHGLHCKNRFSGRYETLLWFSVGKEYIFNLDNVRVLSKQPEKKHYKGPKKGQLSGNPNGKNPSDVWEVVKNDWETAFWDIPNVKSNHVEKTQHPCQFPFEIPARCVLAMTNEGDTVLDPFCGAGTSLLAALMYNRIGIGIDINEEYLKISKNRIQQLKNGELKIRPIGTAVYTKVEKNLQNKRVKKVLLNLFVKFFQL